MTNDMTKGAITPLLIRFTIPLVLGNLFQLTYNAADSIIVGKFVGEDKKTIDAAIKRAADAVECILAEGIDRGMSRFNG